jgi:methylenetetrahydrofolate reductase (NADPH)
MNVIEIMKKNICLSFEVNPPLVKHKINKLKNKINDFYKMKPDYISCSIGGILESDYGRNLEICKMLKDDNSTIPVAHFSNIYKSKGKLRDQLKAYQALEINHFFALRGEIKNKRLHKRYRGEFYSTSEFVEFIKMNNSNAIIAVSGYPEKHILSDSLEAEITQLKLKQNKGADYIISQICYNVDCYEIWLEKIRKAGIMIPIDLGVLPVINRETVLKMCLHNGISIPEELSKLIGKYGDNPEDFKKAGMEYTIQQIHRFLTIGINGVHFFNCINNEEIEKILLYTGIK